MSLHYAKRLPLQRYRLNPTSNPIYNGNDSDNIYHSDIEITSQVPFCITIPMSYLSQHEKRTRVGIRKVYSKDYPSGDDDTEEDSYIEKSVSHSVTQDTEPPPAGVIPTLWYSRECVIHYYVVERILGYQKRSIKELYYTNVDNTTYEPSTESAWKLSRTLLETTINLKERQNISRINASFCPSVLTLAHHTESCKKKPNYKLITLQETEEVLLIKWRGHSYLHCSWERPNDLVRLDITNQTAKGKIKRYYQSQMGLYGIHWKECKEELEYYPRDYLEVERVLACDESEMDTVVFEKQRSLNRDSHDTDITSQKSIITSSIVDEPPWDPEDNVRYVVKWKGLSMSEVTWEYWKYLKLDAVDAVEDFWHRQQVPTIKTCLNWIQKSHPHLSEYKKLIESPVFGISRIKRKIYDENSTKHEYEDTETPLHLRSYQLEGVNWLLWNWWNKRSCILADEMGLGKTIQSLCFLQQLYSLPATCLKGPFLIIAPLSLVQQWQTECETWAPDMNVVLYHGSIEAREFLKEQEFWYSEQFGRKDVVTKLKKMKVMKFHVLITTYEVAMKDVSVLAKVRWKVMVVDEAHRLKNHQSRVFQELASIPRDYCLLLTGTPLQNNTEELWSLLYFSDKNNFHSKDEFCLKFGQLTDSQQVRDLHTLLRPYLLRRVKEDVERSLPPKEETIIEVALTPIQKTYYKAIYEKNISFLMKGSKPANAPSLMNVMMELRKCCNHPFLIKGAEARILQEAKLAAVITKSTVTQTNPDIHTNNSTLAWNLVVGDQLVKSSGKMVFLTKLLPKLQLGGHKILIFSQMVQVLNLLEELLRYHQYKYERLDGSTGASARAAAVSRFNRESFQRFVMLLSTRAGGLGLNLTSADIVVIYDSDWNPQNDLQAMARAHRIGQTRAVRVYRLLTAKTYEMHMFHSASMKLGLDRAVLAHQRQQDGVTSFRDNTTQSAKKKSRKSKCEREVEAKEIDELLKKGAYNVFRDDDDAEAKKFMESDIDQLLHSSQTVVYGSTSGNPLSNGLGNFSKASFVTSDVDGKDIDLDDPDFWGKAVGLEAPLDTFADDHVVYNDGEKRSRKQVQAFDPFQSIQEEEDKKKLKRKEERELIKLKKKQLKEEKIRKKKEKEEKENTKEVTKTKLTYGNISTLSTAKIKKLTSQDAKLLNTKRLERRREPRVLEEEESITCQIKQAWQHSERDRVISATLLFGFGRFSKIRNVANLLSVPLQDIEVFIRQYIYQLGLQASVFLLQQKSKGCPLDYDLDYLFSSLSITDGKWIVDAILSSISIFNDIQLRKKYLRMPSILCERSFLSHLRAGGAMKALRRIAVMNRLNCLMGEVLKQILEDMGHEELGKRGCSITDLSVLDIDFKVRHVTVEELTHVIGRRLVNSENHPIVFSWDPAPWWDHACDIALLIGTFIHGLGNYKDMHNDEDLPFVSRTYQFALGHYGCVQACQNFGHISNLARNVFALESDNNIENQHPLPIISRIKQEVPQTLRQTNTIIDKICSWSKLSLLHIINNSQQEQEERNATYIKEKKNGNQTTEPKGYRTVPLPEYECLDKRIFELLEAIHNNGVHKQIVNDDTIDFVPLNADSFSSTALQHCYQYERLQEEGIPTYYGIIALMYAGPTILQKVIDVEQSDNRDCTTQKIIAISDYIHVKDIPIILHVNSHYRASLGAAILYCGWPFVSNNNLQQNQEIQNELITMCYPNAQNTKLSSFRQLYFVHSHILTIASQFCGQELSMPYESLDSYCTNIYFPHCVRLCLSNNKVKNLKTSNTSLDLVTNIDSRLGKHEIGTIPDPLLPLSSHSIEALQNASAILRRMTLVRSLQFLLGGALEIKDIMSVLKSPIIRNNTDGIPFWWCPWIHDLAMLVHAARFGLLAVVKDFSNTDRMRQLGSTLEVSQLKRHIKTLIMKTNYTLTAKHVLFQTKPLDIDNLTRNYIKFPSASTVERRIGFLIGELSKKYFSNSENRTNLSIGYFHLPMLDHGGWPKYD